MSGALWVLLILIGGATYLLINLHEDKTMPQPQPVPSAQPQMVTADELYQIWMRPEAVTITDDPQRKLRIVGLTDGTTYAAPYADVRAQQARHSEEDCPICDQTERNGR